MTTQAVLDKAAKEVTRLEGETAAELKRREDRIEELERQIAVLSASMTDAINIGSDANYLKDKRAMRDAEDEIEMHRGRIEILKSKLRVSDDDYQKFISDIHKVLDAESEKANAAATEHILEIIRISQGLNEKITQGNQLIDKWLKVTNKEISTRGVYGRPRYDKAALPGWVLLDVINSDQADLITEGKARELQPLERSTVSWVR